MTLGFFGDLGASLRDLFNVGDLGRFLVILGDIG